MSTRRKSLATREPSGRIKREPKPRLLSPAEVRRLVEAAATGLRAAEWGSTLGWLYLQKHISAGQYAAGRRWCEISRDYDMAMQGPRQPRTANLDPSGGTSCDPDSTIGHREARRHVLAVNMGEAGAKRLKLAGDAIERAVADVCEKGEMPAGVLELERLRKGLDVLAALWSGKR